MFKGFLIVPTLALFLLIAACSKSGDSSNNKPSVRNENVRSITQLSDCSFGNPVHALTDSNWFNESVSDSIHFIWELRATADQMTVINNCEYTNSSVRLRAQVSTLYVDNGNSFEWLNEDKDVAQYDDGNFRANCAINVKPMKISYKFVGSCLVLSNPGGSDMVFRSR